MSFGQELDATLDALNRMQVVVANFDGSFASQTSLRGTAREVLGKIDRAMVHLDWLSKHVAHIDFQQDDGFKKDYEEILKLRKKVFDLEGDISKRFAKP